MPHTARVDGQKCKKDPSLSDEMAQASRFCGGCQIVDKNQQASDPILNLSDSEFLAIINAEHESALFEKQIMTMN